MTVSFLSCFSSARVCSSILSNWDWDSNAGSYPVRHSVSLGVSRLQLANSVRLGVFCLAVVELNLIGDVFQVAVLFDEEEMSGGISVMYFHLF